MAWDLDRCMIRLAAMTSALAAMASVTAGQDQNLEKVQALAFLADDSASIALVSYRQNSDAVDRYTMLLFPIAATV